MNTTEQPTFWQFTIKSTKEAVRLYFQPVRQAVAWLGDDSEARSGDTFEARLQNLERRIDPSFDSLEDLELRFDRLESRARTGNQLTLAGRLDDIERLLQSAHFLQRNRSVGLPEVLHEVRLKIRETERALGLESPLYLPPAKRTRGASGD